MNQFQLIKEHAFALGFNTVGVIPARPGRRLDAYLNWIERERHGTMGYLARPDRLSRRQDLNVILPGVQSIICVALDYFSQTVPVEIASDPSRGRISNYAWGVDYHDIMTPRLETLAAWLNSFQPGESHSRVYVDTGAILERDHGETAGLGFTGKNTMLIHPRRGSYFFLGEILTTLSINEGPEKHSIRKSNMPTCGTCRRCLSVCPTDAFPEPYLLDARRCISYLTIELKGWIPAPLRPLMGNWIYGCDICQEVCPFNRFTRQTREAAFHASHWNSAAPPLLNLLGLKEAQFNERYQQGPIKRLKWNRFLRNVCVAAGNWGSPTAVRPLAALLAHPDPLVRGHAAWALHQIDVPDAQRAVQAALTTEPDERVRLEMGSS